MALGLQEPEKEVTALGVAMNKGFGVGDTLIYIPLLVLGLVGLWSRKMWGVFAMAGAMAITAYWPVASLFIILYAREVPGFHFPGLAGVAIMLGGLTVYGLWALCYLYSHRQTLSDSSR